MVRGWSGVQRMCVSVGEPRGSSFFCPAAPPGRRFPALRRLHFYK